MKVNRFDIYLHIDGKGVKVVSYPSLEEKWEVPKKRGRKRKEPEYAEIICKNCGKKKEVLKQRITGKKIQKFCSPKCGYEWKKKQSAKRNPEVARAERKAYYYKKMFNEMKKKSKRVRVIPVKESPFGEEQPEVQE